MQHRSTLPVVITVVFTEADDASLGVRQTLKTALVLIVWVTASFNNIKNQMYTTLLV